MSWIPLAILAPLLWAASNFVDKYIVGSHYRGAYDFAFFCALEKWPFFFLTLLFVPVPVLTSYSFIPIIAGALLVYSYGFYARAFEEGETSTLVLFFNFIPIGVLILSYLFLGQTLTHLQSLAFIIVLVGSFVISFDVTTRRFHNTKGLVPISIAIVLWSIVFTLAAVALTHMSFGQFFLLDTLGSALAGLPMLLFPRMRSEIFSGLRSQSARKYFIFLGNGVLDYVGQGASKYALTMAPSAALVTLVTQTQSLFSIAMGVLLTLSIPHIIKEDISWQKLPKKIIGAVIMFAGIFLLV